MGTRVRFRRLGRHQGTNDVEPSCGLLDVMGDEGIQWRILVDCGTTPIKGGGNAAPDLSALKDGRPIDLVLITHAHWDHLGALPALLPYLALGGTIRMTRPTYRMAKRILENDVKFAQQRDPSVAFSETQVRETLRRVQEITKPGEHEFLPGLMVYVHPEGHINGACSYTLRIGAANVLYTGDRCDHDQPGVLGARPMPLKWYPTVIAGSDCTYGASPDSDGRNWGLEMARAVSETSESLRRGQRVMFFTFSVHRGGAVAHALQAGGVPNLGRVYLDGSARDFARMMMNNTAKWCGRDQPLILSRVGMISNQSERIAAGSSKRGFAVICPPGMGGPGGVGTWWRRLLIPDPDATVAFTGFVAPGSDGHILLEAAKARDESGDKNAVVRFLETDRRHGIQPVVLPLRCKVAQYRLGGHNSRRDTVAWFRQFKPEVIVLSHGSKAALESMEAELSTEKARLIRTDLEPDFELEL